MKVSPTNSKSGTARALTLPVLLVLFAFTLMPAATAQAQTASAAPINGEIERLTLNSQKDPWSGGVIVVGGQNIIIPRNLLMDLPANRITLNQAFAQAPAACLSRAESGLAKADFCNANRPVLSRLFMRTAPVPATSSPATSTYKKVLRRSKVTSLTSVTLTVTFA